MIDDPVVVAGYARTPMGGFMGDLSAVPATGLGAAAVGAAVERSGVPPQQIERIYMGCVLPTGLRQAPARQAALGAGLPNSVEATTVNKMCGSGMQAAIMAFEALAAGCINVAVAGGMESMSNAPFALLGHRSGKRLGHDGLVDTMLHDGLEDAYEPGKVMGVFADAAARNLGFAREAQDAYALRSLDRALAAIDSGAFAGEIVPVPVRTRGGDVLVETDEQPGKARPDRIPGMKPAFTPDGTVTAANASSISDGAAALVLTRQSVALRLGLPVAARILATSAHAHAPADFPTAPVPAIEKLLRKTGWSVADVDLFEVNEAFAVVAMIAARALGIPDNRLNVNGGATALGHPIGASGTRIVVTLIAALQARGLRRGVASLCIGGGEATALALELV